MPDGHKQELSDCKVANPLQERQAEADDCDEQVRQVRWQVGIIATNGLLIGSATTNELIKVQIPTGWFAS
jgi:hypothetical protein